MNIIVKYKPMLSILFLFGLISFHSKNNKIYYTSLLLISNLIRSVMITIYLLITIIYVYPTQSFMSATGKINEFATVMQLFIEYSLFGILLLITIWKTPDQCKFFNDIIDFDNKFNEMSQNKYFDDNSISSPHTKFILFASFCNVCWVYEFRNNLLAIYVLFFIGLCFTLISFGLSTYHFEQCAWILIERYQKFQKFMLHVINDENSNLDNLLSLLENLFQLIENYRKTFGEMLLVNITFYFICTTENVYSYYVRWYKGLINTYFGHIWIIFIFVADIFFIIPMLFQALQILANQVIFVYTKL